MQKSYISKIVCLNAIIVIINVLVFSDRILSFRVTSSNVLIQALSITIIIMSLLAFLYGNYKLINEMLKPSIYVVDEYNNSKDYVVALNSFLNRRIFTEDINTVINQIKQLERKKQTLEELLFQKYKETMSDIYTMKQVVEDTSDLVFENIKKLINRLTIFDQAEYDRLLSNKGNSEAYFEKYQLYNEHIQYIKGLVEQNEKILLEFDHLLIEVSKMGDSKEDTLDELDNIKDTIKAMKQLRVGSDEMFDLEDKYKNQ